MKPRTLRLLVPFLLVLVLTMLAPAHATAEIDPPYRVARLSSLEGDVSFSPAGTEDWVGAVLNRPITTGDRFWCNGNGRAELQVGSAAIRLGHQTAFSFLNLGDQMMQIRLTEGGLLLRVRSLSAGEVIEIDTPNLAFSIRSPGRYRIDANQAGDTTIISIREGEGEAMVNGASYAIHGGQQAVFNGVGALRASFEALPPPDNFDLWADARENRETSYTPRSYVSADVVGYEDLNEEYGSWRSEPEYGHVWFPRVTVVGWAPYRYGHWAWISPWGWTWIDDAPWGFAPFHYGRWVHVHDAWGWVPCPPRAVGVAYVRPVYAPALVAWVGGRHGGVGVAIGSDVGWFPLGPRDVYMPSYPASRTYVKNVNITNTTVNQTIINKYYNSPATSTVQSPNQHIAGAVTTVSSQSFASAQPVAGNMTRVTPKDLATAPATTTAPRIAPPKKAVLGAGAPTSVQPPPATLTRQVVVKTPPPAPTPAFATQQEAIRENKGRPISIPQTQRLQPPASQPVPAPPVKILPKLPTDNAAPSRSFEDRPPTARPTVPMGETKPVPAPGYRPQGAPPQDAKPGQFDSQPPKRAVEEHRPTPVPPVRIEESKPAPRDTYRPPNPAPEPQPRQYEPPQKTRSYEDRPPAARPAIQMEEPKPVPHDTYRPPSLPQEPQPRQYEPPQKARPYEDRPPVTQPSIQMEEPKPAPHDTYRPPSPPPQVFQPRQSEQPQPSMPRFEPKPPPAPQPPPQPMRQEVPQPSPPKHGRQPDQEKGANQQQNPFK